MYSLPMLTDGTHASDTFNLKSPENVEVQRRKSTPYFRVAKDNVCRSCTSEKLTRKRMPESSGSRQSERLGIIYSNTNRPILIK